MDVRIVDPSRRVVNLDDTQSRLLVSNRHTPLYHELMVAKRFVLGQAWNPVADLARRVGQRLRRPLLILISGIVLLMLLIAVLQSGLGVDSDVTITDSQRPEIVGGE